MKTRVVKTLGKEFGEEGRVSVIGHKNVGRFCGKKCY